MPDAPPVLGLHHVTAITADAQANHDFYAGVLGLRLVKKTVNFDDPTSYHLYYGDETGSPGSIVTFFAYPGLPKGRAGWPQVTELEAPIHDGSAWAWADRIQRAGHPVHTMCYAVYVGDPDFGRPTGVSETGGFRFRLVDQLADTLTYWAGEKPAVDESHYRRIGPIEFVRMTVPRFGPSLDFFREVLGFGTYNLNLDFTCLTNPATGEPFIWLQEDLEAPRGRPGAGTVHHVAFRVATDADQLALREHLLSAGVNVSPVMDRTYFKSIYFREPGGVLLEVATDGPGFAVDEPAGSLGTRLCLPPQYESRRAEIEAGLPPLRT